MPSYKNSQGVPAGHAASAASSPMVASAASSPWLAAALGAAASVASAASAAAVVPALAPASPAGSAWVTALAATGLGLGFGLVAACERGLIRSAATPS